MAKQAQCYVSALKNNTAGNFIKEAKVREMLFPFRHALKFHTNDMLRNLQKNNVYPQKYCLTKAKDNDTRLSARYWSTMYSQAYENMISYLTLLQTDIKRIIAKSSLNDYEKMILFRLNKYNNWYVKEISLTWIIDENGEYLVAKKDEEGSVLIAVESSLLKLMRRIVKYAKRKRHSPTYNKIRTFKLNANVHQVESSVTTLFNRWVKISVLEKGKPVLIPLKNNSFLEDKLNQEDTKLLKSIQLYIGEKDIDISLLIETPKVDIRKEGDFLGLDWGLKSLFTTSDGRFVGRKLYDKLVILDTLIIEEQKKCQENGVKLNSSELYRKLNKRIANFVKNEVGRILNKLTTAEIKGLVVEKLDFRHGELSKMMNRIISRAGRSAVRNKLQRLQETHGIEVIEVNPAYTSQICNNCGYVHKTNRKNQATFKCGCCGKKINADINAARNILARCSSNIPVVKHSKEFRKNLYDNLQKEHLKRCSKKRNCCTTKRNIGLLE